MQSLFTSGQIPGAYNDWFGAYSIELPALANIITATVYNSDRTARITWPFEVRLVSFF